MFMTGEVETLTVFEAVAVHPLFAVAVTEYVVETLGDTVIDDVVTPELQRYVDAPEAVNVVL